MKLRFLFVCLTLFVYSNAQISISNLEKHIYFLADDQMKGRQTGSKEVRKAARYIERHFKKYGLEPLGEKKYRQRFDAKVKRVVVKDSIRKSDNIIGFLNNGAKKTIVIGAHYDHIGLGDLGNSRDSLNIGKIHNGADDNASGVAGLLELVRYYSTNGTVEDYNFLFIAFAAEELGLLGSKHFVENPTLSLDKVHWMLNMDMIGRYQKDQGLSIIGYGTSSTFPEIFEGVSSDLYYYTSNDGRGGSDQTSFYDKEIPVLFFHTGGHPDYHRTGDDAHKIDYEALKAILEIEIQVIDNSMKVDEMDFIWTN